MLLEEVQLPVEEDLPPVKKGFFRRGLISFLFCAEHGTKTDVTYLPGRKDGICNALQHGILV